MTKIRIKMCHFFLSCRTGGIIIYANLEAHPKPLLRWIPWFEDRDKTIQSICFQQSFGAWMAVVCKYHKSNFLLWFIWGKDCFQCVFWTTAVIERMKVNWSANSRRLHVSSLLLFPLPSIEMELWVMLILSALWKLLEGLEALNG